MAANTCSEETCSATFCARDGGAVTHYKVLTNTFTHDAVANRRRRDFTNPQQSNPCQFENADCPWMPICLLTCTSRAPLMDSSVPRGARFMLQVSKGTAARMTALEGISLSATEDTHSQPPSCITRCTSCQVAAFGGIWVFSTKCRVDPLPAR
eukprot:5660224-Amphidinium_carterae.1